MIYKIMFLQLFVPIELLKEHSASLQKYHYQSCNYKVVHLFDRLLISDFDQICQSDVNFLVNIKMSSINMNSKL